MVNEIRIPIIGEDRASRPMKDVAASADIAAAGARRLADALKSQERAADAAARADLSLAKANAILDVTEHKINAEQDRVRQKIKNDLQAARGPGLGRALVSGSAFKAFFSGGGGAGGAAGAAGGAAPAASPLLDFFGSPAGIGAGAAAAFPASALIDALIGQGLGTGVAGVGAGLVAKFNPRVLAPGLTNIQKTLSTVAQSIGPSLGMMLAQFGRFVQGMAPQLSKLFASSLPFMQQFFKLAEIGAKTILPALTQVLQSMVKSGALKQMTQAFVFLIQGVAGFIKAIGPGGMKAGAATFRVIAMGIRDILVGLGKTLNWLGGAFGHFLSWAHSSWDHFRHDTANVFDGVRHDIAHYWDLIWGDTVGKVQRGVKAVNDWFHKLPGMLLASLAGLGSRLFSFAKSALGDLLRGLRSVAPSIFSWAKNFITSLPGMFLHWLHMSPPHPGSAFYDLGANMMHHLEAGMQARAQKIGVGAALGGIVLGGGAGSAQKIAQGLLGRYGWGNQWAALNAVAMRESGWSTTARNPSSGAYGIAQFINGPSEYYQYGGNPNTVAGQVIGFFNYIKQRYGNPSAAWAHEQAFGWYGSGLANGVFTKPTLIGVGERGPELVNVRPLHGGGGGGGNNYTINVHVPPNANLREVGRVTVEAIKMFEKASGAGWRR